MIDSLWHFGLLDIHFELKEQKLRNFRKPTLERWTTYNLDTFFIPQRDRTSYFSRYRLVMNLEKRWPNFSNFRKLVLWATMQEIKKPDFVLQFVESKEERVQEMEAIIATQLIKPITFLANNCIPSPHKICYNPTTRRFIISHGSLTRKVRRRLKLSVADLLN